MAKDGTKICLCCGGIFSENDGAYLVTFEPLGNGETERYWLCPGCKPMFTDAAPPESKVKPKKLLQSDEK